MKRSLLIVLCLGVIATGIGRRYVPSRSFIGIETVLHFKLYNSPMCMIAGPGTNGRVFDYSLNEITGDLYDPTRPMTLLPKWPGFYFDGVDDFIYTSASHQSVFRNSYSVMLWVKPDDGQPAAQDYLAGCRNAAAEDEITLSILANGRVQFTYETNNVATNCIDTAVTFVNGAGNPWTFIVGTTNETDGKMELYIDTVLQQTTDTIGATFNDFATDCNPNLGALNLDTTLVGYGNWFAGLISDFRIVDKQLSQTEITNIYNTTRWRYQK